MDGDEREYLLSSSSSSSSSSRSSSSSHDVDTVNHFRSPSQQPSAPDLRAHTAGEDNHSDDAAATGVIAFSMKRLNLPVAGRSIRVSPFLMYHLARNFGFPKRIIVFPSKGTAEEEDSSACCGRTSQSQSYARGLFQFDSAAEALDFIDQIAELGHRTSANRAVMEVQLSDDCPDVFIFSVERAKETRVFVTKNTSYGLVITPSVMFKMGPVFEYKALNSPPQPPPPQGY